MNVGVVWANFKPQSQKTKKPTHNKFLIFFLKKTPLSKKLLYFSPKNFFLYFRMTADQLVRPNFQSQAQIINKNFDIFLKKNLIFWDDCWSKLKGQFLNPSSKKKYFRKIVYISLKNILIKKYFFMCLLYIFWYS